MLFPMSPGTYPSADRWAPVIHLLEHQVEAVFPAGDCTRGLLEMEFRDKLFSERKSHLPNGTGATKKTHNMSEVSNTTFPYKF